MLPRRWNSQFPLLMGRFRIPFEGIINFKELSAHSIMTSLSTASYPKLRAIDVRTHTQDNQAYYLLRDPLQLTDQQLLVPQSLGPLLALCDGTHEASSLSGAFQLRYGVRIDPIQVQYLIEALDEALLLENDRFTRACQAARDAYRRAPCRTPALAGPSYPDDPERLAKMLNSYLANTVDKATSTAYRGLLSPHIDYQRGGPVYAQVWHDAAAAARAADLVILFGTDHTGGDPFTLTRQHYATPYGILPTPFELVDELAAGIGEEAAYAGELRHCGEHSLELVAVWLHHMRGGTPVELVPILVGGMHRHIVDETDPADDPLISHVLDTLAEATRGRRVLGVASGDMAHVGPAFGGDPLNFASRATLKRADDDLLQQMVAGDTAGFFSAIRRIEDRNNVCGVTPIYLTMRLLEQMAGPIRGQQVAYDTCPADEANTSVVTISGVLLHEASGTP